jgi:hypothetical protein
MTDKLSLAAAKHRRNGSRAENQKEDQNDRKFSH